MTFMKFFLLALTLARRDLRGGMNGVGVFLACLALGVAAVSGVQSLSAGFSAGIAADAAKLLGGDVEIRLTHVPASPDRIAFMKRFGTLSSVTAMRAMAAGESANGEKPKRALAALKAVDGAYPLYGKVELSPDIPLSEALAQKDGLYGAVADQEALDRLGLSVGDAVRLANGRFQIRAVLVKEPDRDFSLSGLGPRLTISLGALPQTGLLMPGSLTSHRYRLRLFPGVAASQVKTGLDAAFPKSGWRIRDASGSAPGVSRFLDRLAAVLSLVGLSALLLGGLGAAEAVRGHLEGKSHVIAAMKCLGAPGRLVFTVFFLEVLFLALTGTFLGLAAGALAPFIAAPLIENLSPVRLIPALYPGALAVSGLFGVLTAVIFSLYPLASARRVPALTLFRGYAEPGRPRPGPAAHAAVFFCAAALTALAAIAVKNVWLALGFAGSVLGAVILFRLLAALMVRFFKAAPPPRSPLARLALSALSRPGNQVAPVMASLGLGFAVLSAMALVDANFRDRMEREIPEMAPAFFFIDIQPYQYEDFRRALASIPGVRRLDAAPNIRGRFAAVNGRGTETITPAEDAAWAARGDRALSFSGPMPQGTEITAGAWWPEDYAGPPLVSVDEEIAKGFGVKTGDALTFTVLGKDIEARVASLRRIDWLTLGMNYVFTFSPGALDGLPLTYLATLYTDAPPGALDRGVNKAVFDAAAEGFPNVSVIAVGEALHEVEAIADKIAAAVTAAAAVTLLAGTLVLMQTMRAALRRRTYETVIFKVCGAGRKDILTLLLMEHALLGLAAGLASLALGCALSAFFVGRYLRFPWEFFPGPALGAVAGAAAVTLCVSLAGIWRLLGKKAWPYLRNE